MSKSVEELIKSYLKDNPETGLVSQIGNFDIEPTFDKFVKNYGGERVSELLADKANLPSNADYIFRNDLAIVELKCLEVDYSWANFYNKVLQAAIDARVDYSDLVAFIEGDGPFPPAAVDLFRKRFKRYIESIIAKARKQIRSTGKLFGPEYNCRALLIANDKIIYPSHQYIVFTIASVVNNYWSVDLNTVIYYTGNVYIAFPGIPKGFCGWQPFYVNDHANAAFSKFVDPFGTAWLDWIQKNLSKDGNKPGFLTPAEVGLEFLRQGHRYREKE